MTRLIPPADMEEGPNLEVLYFTRSLAMTLRYLVGAFMARLFGRWRWSSVLLVRQSDGSLFAAANPGLDDGSQKSNNLKGCHEDEGDEDLSGLGTFDDEGDI